MLSYCPLIGARHACFGAVTVRYFFRVEFDGSTFHGWQRQPDVESVQAVLEQALSTVLRTPISVVGAGRTDTGVHARRLGVHFDIDADIDTFTVMRALNGMLGPRVAVAQMQIVENDFHARFSAVGREYAYRIVTQSSPWWYGRVWHCRYDVDWERVEQGLIALVGGHDFSTFCAAGNSTGHNRCTVTTASLDRRSQPYVINLGANRFVYRMVRSLVGTLVDIGRGVCECSMAELLAACDRTRAGTTAPACGLTLENVFYRGVKE